MNTLHSEFKNKLKKISELSDKINGGDKKKIFKLIKEHITEVEELYNTSNEHWTIETADLIILCYVLLILDNKDINKVFDKCLPRYVKLKKLAINAKNTIGNNRRCA